MKVQEKSNQNKNTSSSRSFFNSSILTQLNVIKRHNKPLISTPRTTRVLVAIGAYPPSYSGGGLRAHRTYKYVSKFLPIEIVVITQNPEGEKPGWSEYDGFPIYTIDTSKGQLFALLSVLKFFLKIRMKRTDIVHGMGRSLSAKLVCVAARFLRIPLIRECTLSALDSGIGGRNPINKLDLKTFSDAKLVIALNSKIRQFFLDIGVKQERIWLRPNPVDTQVFRFPTEVERSDARERFFFTSKDVVHLVLAPFMPRKNQLLAVKALSMLPDNHKLLLAGPVLHGYADYEKEIHELVKNTGLSDRVILFPKQIEDVVPFFHASDSCWVPSVHEGLPNVMLEGLCCGLPVIVNRELNVHEFLKEGTNALAVPCQASSFAKAVISLENIITSSPKKLAIASSAQKKFDSNIINTIFIDHLSKIMPSEQYLKYESK